MKVLFSLFSGVQFLKSSHQWPLLQVKGVIHVTQVAQASRLFNQSSWFVTVKKEKKRNIDKAASSTKFILHFQLYFLSHENLLIPSSKLQESNARTNSQTLTPLLLCSSRAKTRANNDVMLPSKASHNIQNPSWVVSFPEWAAPLTNASEPHEVDSYESMPVKRTIFKTLWTDI